VFWFKKEEEKNSCVKHIAKKTKVAKK